MNRVFLNSIPKAGTNLVLTLLVRMGYKHVGSIDTRMANQKVLGVIPRSIVLGNAAQTVSVGIDSPVRVDAKRVASMLTRAADKAVVAAHVGYEEAILGMVKSLAYRPVLMVRDPRAVLASFVPYVLGNRSHHLHQTLSSAGARDQQFEIAYEGCQAGGRALAHLLTRCESVEAWRASNDVLVCRFEDFLSEEQGGSDATQSLAIERLAEHVGFVGDLGDVARALVDSRRHTFRVGRRDSWTEELPESIKSRIKAEMTPLLSAWGYD